MRLPRTVFLVAILGLAGVAGYFFAIPRTVERAEIEGEEVCPSVVLAGDTGGALRARPLALSRVRLDVPPGAALYLCEDLGDWLGVVAPAGDADCSTAARDAASPLPPHCTSGWIRRSATVFAAG